MSSPGGVPAGPVSRRARLLWIGVVALIVIVVLTLVTIGIASSGNLASPSASPSAPATPDDSGPTDSPSPTAPPGTGTPAPIVPAPGDPPIEVKDPLPIDATAKPEPGVTVTVGAFDAVEGEARLPGDVAGPAIRFTLSITNGTASKVSLASTLVNVYYGADQSPASELQKPGGVPLPASVAPGATAKGTLVYTLPEDQRDDVLITVDYQVGDPVIAFQGAIPD